MNPDHSNTVFNWLITAIGGLVAATTFLWKRAEASNAERINDLKKRLDECAASSKECYEDRLNISLRLERLESQSGISHPPK